MEYTPSREDYIVAIYILKRQKAVVRSVDVAQLLGYARASVSYAIHLLEKNGLVTIGEHKWLCLTPMGEEKAEKIYSRYRIVLWFLQKLPGVSAQTAIQDTCRLEHVISEETLECIRQMRAHMAKKE